MATNHHFYGMPPDFLYCGFFPIKDMHYPFAITIILLSMNNKKFSRDKCCRCVSAGKERDVSQAGYADLPPPPLEVAIFKWKMRNVLKRMKNHISDFSDF